MKEGRMNLIHHRPACCSPGRLRKVASTSAGICLLLLVYVPLWAATVHVPQDQPTVQQGVEAAQAGDTVLVASGRYDDVVSLGDNVTLRGSGNTTRLSDTVKVVDAEGVTISSLQVEGGPENSHFGIFCLNAEVTIENVSVQNFHHGISAENSQIYIQNCTISNGFNVGLLLTQQTKAIIESSSVTNSVVGIMVSATERSVQIHDNLIADNDVGVECHAANPQLRANVITRNLMGLTIDDALPDLGTEENLGSNSIVDNDQLAIRYEGKEWLSAQMNWWGRTTGPLEGQIDGRVRVAPWLMTDPQMAYPVLSSSRLCSRLWGIIKRATRFRY